MDIRWKQRFSHYNDALKWLEKTINYDGLDFIEQAAAIHFFAMCCELSWKLLKDYLEYQGFKDVAAPKAAIKHAFNLGLIKDGHNWMQLLNDRNLTSHVYDEETATNFYNLISERYFPMFKKLHVTFSELSTKE